MTRVNHYECNETGYAENLYKHDGIYFRIVRERSGDWYKIYYNYSLYGSTRYDVDMNERFSTVGECEKYIKNIHVSVNGIMRNTNRRK